MMLQSKSIGNKIAAARKKNNLSQADLAQQVSISSQAVGKWERGESMPDISTLNRLAEILGVDLNYFSDKFSSTNAESGIAESLSAELTYNLQSSNQKRGWDMSKGHWVDADFSGLKNLQEKFANSNMKNCRFMGSEMIGLVLKSNNVDTCDFSNADLSSSRLQASHVINNNFKECSMIQAELAECYIKNCNFQNADLAGVQFRSSSFVSNIVPGVIWNDVSFQSSEISNIVFEGSVQNCAFEYCSFSKVTFKNSILRNTFFKCKTLKHIQFINCQADRMTFEFLKNGKANLKGISLISDI